MNFLRLIRYPNLIMIVVAQLLMRYTLVVPLLVISQKYILVTTVDFILIVVSTVLIAAGGYIVNDIEDRKTDSINKPQKIIVGDKISVNDAYKLYYILTALGVGMGCYLQFYRPLSYIGYLHIVAAGLLYFYSTTYKGMLILGNIIVSLLTALSLAVVVITEPLALSDATILTLTAGYFVFAFLMSWIRELIKDMEDIVGDAATNLKTLPVVAGISAGKITSIIISIITLTILIFIQIISEQWTSLMPFIYVLFFIQIPLLLIMMMIAKAKEKKDFTTVSLFAKGIMVSGLLSMLVFYLSYN